MSHPDVLRRFSPSQPRRLVCKRLPLRQGPTRCHPSAVDDIGATRCFALRLTGPNYEPSLPPG